jgi:hypothetical protein
MRDCAVGLKTGIQAWGICVAAFRVAPILAHSRHSIDTDTCCIKLDPQVSERLSHSPHCIPSKTAHFI